MVELAEAANSSAKRTPTFVSKASVSESHRANVRQQSVHQ